MKLTVLGEGALELYESPKILENPEVERFDTNSDLVIGSDFTGTKTFNMTYLGRESFDSVSKVMPFSYFDTKKMEYVTVNLDLGSITVAGSQQVVRSQGNKVNEPQVNTVEDIVRPKIDLDLTPVYQFNNSYLYNKKYIFLFLVFLLSILMIYKFLIYFKRKMLLKPDLYKVIEKEGINYARLHKLISNLGKGSNMKDIIDKSNLSSGTKKYFQELIIKCELDYKNDSNVKTYKLKKKSLMEVIEILNDQNAIS